MCGKPVKQGGEKMSKTNTQNDIGLTGPLQFELLADGQRARLTRPFKVKLKSGYIVEVPEGFETDFASVPRFFWRIVPPWGRYSPAAVVHDYLYQTGMFSRIKSDRIFLFLMKKLGVPLWKRQTMYWAVRIGGFKSWNECRSKQINKLLYG